MKKILLIAALCLQSFMMYAQNKVSIKGQIIQSSGEAMPYSTIQLLKLPDSLRIAGAVADMNGRFEFQKIQDGNYILVISTVGYITALKTFLINKQNSDQTIDIGRVSLVEDSKMLNEVVISGQKPTLEFEQDRVVLNVEKLIASSGSSVLELLEQVPGVQVDRQNQTVQINGKAGVRIFVNGKPTYLTGQELGNFLAQLNSNSVQRLEVIDRPSAKYDAEGNAGIIDIKLKRSVKMARDGSVYATLGYGEFDKINGGYSLSAPIGKSVNLLTSYDYNSNKTFTDAYYTRIVNPDLFIYQDYYRLIRSHAHQFRTALDAQVGEKGKLSLELRGNIFRSSGYLNSETFFNQGEFSTSQADSILQLNNNLQTKRDNWTANASYEIELDTIGQSVSFSMGLIDFYSKQEDEISNSFRLPLPPFNEYRNPVNLNGATPINIQIIGSQVDYIKPINKTTSLETGLKTSHTKTVSDVRFSNILNGQPETNDRFSNLFNYTEHIYAGYILFKKSFQRVKLDLGLRYEQFTAEGESNKLQEKVTRNQGYLFPSISIAKSVTQDHRFTLGYNRRIDRPSFSDFNPAINFVSYYSTYQGNPLLLPALSSNLSFNYTFKNEFTATLTYTNTDSPMTYSFFQDDATAVSEVSLLNFDRFNNISLTLGIPVSITKWWRSTFSGNGFISRYESNLNGEDFINKQYSYTMSLQNAFTLTKTLSAEINYNYRGPSVYGLLNTISTASLNVGVQQKFKNGSTVRLNASDLFRQMRAYNTVVFQNQDIGNYTLFETRIVRLTFTYPLGKGNGNQRNVKRSLQEEERRIE